MDFSLSARAAGTAAAHAQLHPRQDHPAGGRSAADRARADRGIPPRTGGAWARGRSARAACVAGIRRPRAEQCRQGRGVRGSRLFAARPGRDAHLRARRGQHPPAGGGRHAGAEGALAAAAGARRHPLLLLHDRAGARRRIRSVGAEHHGGAGRQPLGDQRRPSGSSPARMAPASRSSWPRARTARRRCSWPTWISPASRSCAPWTAWTRRSPAAMPWCGSTICACRPATSWASRARVSATRRCGWRRRG